MSSQFDRRIPELVRNLTHLYSLATPDEITSGVQWYPNAHAIVYEWAKTFDKSVVNIACIIAALSPQCVWERNLIIADDIIRGDSPSISGALRVNVEKATRIRDDEAEDITRYFPCGPKVASFALNLAGAYQHPTIDTHAMQAALNDVRANYTLKPQPYAAFARAYELAAWQLKYPPALFQAIIWHVWKRLNPTDYKRRRRGAYWIAIKTD